MRVWKSTWRQGYRQGERERERHRKESRIMKIYTNCCCVIVFSNIFILLIIYSFFLLKYCQSSFGSIEFDGWRSYRAGEKETASSSVQFYCQFVFSQTLVFLNCKTLSHAQQNKFNKTFAYLKISFLYQMFESKRNETEKPWTIPAAQNTM